MRAFRCFTLLLITVTLVLPQAALSAQRIVLLESFTNVSCPPCATSNPITHQFVEDYGTVLVLNVQYHMSWPSATDPFYLTDTAANDAARAYYGVNGVPDLVTDGSNEPSPGSYAELERSVQPRILTDAPLEIVITPIVVGDQITVDVDVTAVSDVPAAGLVLRIAIVEPYVAYASPPGSNGETEFHCSMRDMLPAFGGTALSITNGQTLHFSEVGTLDPTWQDVYVVAWVQNNENKEVLQTASTLVRPDYAMFYGSIKGGDIADLATMASFPTVVCNVGTQSDVYDLHLDKNLPLGWAASVCIGVTCYPPFVTEFEVPLASLVQQEVLIDITPLETAGSGTVTMTATSRNDPTQSWSKTLMVMTAGDDVLLVDDDGGEAWETFYAQAIGSTAKTHAIWDANAFGSPNGDQLDHYGTVVWSSGFGPPTKDAVTGLTSYLDAGGNLLLSGQLIGYYTFGSGAPLAGQAFYNDYLGANYIAYITTGPSVEGIPGDVLSDGMVFDLGGGDGADNSSYPEEIEAYGDGVLSMVFTKNAGSGAVHLDNGTFKTVFLSFGFEGIATQADRDLLMSRALDFLVKDLSAVPGNQVGSAFLASLPLAAPNPFNPSTTIKFDIGGTTSTALNVKVFDVRGRLVATVYDGLATPGPQYFTWDGKSTGGREVASGVYLVRVQLADLGVAETFKMTLAK